ncbi:MAG: ribosome-associated translation inhibitor RaiA [Clostridiales bacterium]|jgi:putative sigma-54 modulation protein|nr:ribosome-associated translation inhibitor RaiA [Clostridiales bacterium]
MRFSFSGKNVIVTEELKEKCSKKIGRLERLFPPDVEVHVTFSVTKQENRIEVTIPLHRRMLRSEVSANDLYTAIDMSVDALDKQMVKYKNRIKDKSRRDNAFREEATEAVSYSPDPAEPDAGGEDGDVIRIERTKKFALKPMDAEEAVMEMEMLDHVFYVFRNSQTEEVNVVYKRNNGSYGLIEPEY